MFVWIVGHTRIKYIVYMANLNVQLFGWRMRYNHIGKDGPTSLNVNLQLFGEGLDIGPTRIECESLLNYPCVNPQLFELKIGYSRIRTCTSLSREGPYVQLFGRRDGYTRMRLCMHYQF